MNIGFGIDRRDELRIQAGISASSLEIAAESIANKHFSDPFVRDDFKRDISNFITENMRFFDMSGNDRDRKEVIYNLSEEKNSLLKQSSELSLGTAKVYINATLDKINNDYGYWIDGFGVIVGTIQSISGGLIVAGSFATGNPVGVVIGIHVFLSGFDSVTESVERLRGNKEAVGFMKDAYMNGAEYLGFSRKQGLIAFHSVDAVTSAYGALKFVVKPSARRLFHYMPNEYVRKFQTMSKTMLTLNFFGTSYKGAVAYGVNSSQTGQYDY
jgi:hypothetical protein